MGIFGEFLQMLFGFTLPEQAAANAYLVDDLYNVVMVISIVGTLGIFGAIVFFVVKYHKSQNEKSAYIPHNALAETLWTVIPTIIFLAIGVWGIWAFYKMEAVPSNAHTINLTAKQWMWEVTYKKNGKEASGVDIIYLPVDKPVVVKMTSVDVLHSFYVPSFRVKRDVVPGMNSQVSFTPTKKGDFRIFCAEFCGTRHSKMRGIVRVVSAKRYDKWLDRQIKEANISDPVELGSRLFARKGCMSCHSTNGKAGIGPSLKDVWGKTESLSDGSTVEVNAEYIRESILVPNAKLVKGYGPKMNSFAGQLSEKEIGYLIEYFKTLK